MKQRRRRAPKGRRPTPPSPSIQELLGVPLERKHAALSGHHAALVDALNACGQGAHDDDLVTGPCWVVARAYDIVIDAMIAGSQGMGTHARWWRQYRDDLIHWHRYACVQQALKDRRATRLDVYDVVARELAGTAFAAKPSGVKYSAENVVARALKKGEHARFYRSTAVHVYDSLLKTPGTFFFRVKPRVKSTTSLG
jgi:hypothetical protein